MERKLASLGLIILFVISLGLVPVLFENYTMAKSITQETAYWAKSYGGDGLDEANAVAVAPNGDIIIVGYTWSFNAAYNDVWVLRLDENGTVKWQKTYGGSDWEGAYAVAVAPNGDIVVVGYTYGFNTRNGDMWVLRLDENGTVKWEKTYGEFSFDRGYGVVIDENSGDILIAGYSYSTIGSIDAWVLRLDENGTVKWQKTYGGSDIDGARAIALADNGDIIVAGFYGATDWRYNGADLWVFKLDGDGTLKWQKVYGGNGKDEAYGVALTDNGDVIVAGYTDSFGAGGKDAWILGLNGDDGSVKWQKTYGGSGDDEAHAVAIENGDVIVVGYTESFGAGRGDVWVFGLDGEGNVTWEKTYGGYYSDGANSIAITLNRNVIVAGYTDSFGAGGGDCWALNIPLDGYLPPEGIRDLGFHTGDSNAIVTVTNVAPADNTPSIASVSLSEGNSSAIIQDTNAIVKTQYHYTGPTELSLTPPTPENGSVVTSGYIFVNVTSNNLLESALLEWNGQNLTMQKASDTSWYLNVTSLANGEYTFKVWGRDLSEKWVASEVRTVTVNGTIHLLLVPPTPADGAVVNTDYVIVNVAADQPLETALLEWNGKNITMQKLSSENWYFNVTNLTNGVHSFKVWGNDSLGNWFSSETRTITVNSTVYLSFVFPTPENGSVVDINYVFVNVTSSQPPKTALLEWNGENITMNKASDTNWYLNVTNVTNGVYSFRVWGNDSLGNWFSTEMRAITVNTTVHLLFVPPTPENGSVVATDYVFVNVTSSQPLEVAKLEWDGENITMNETSDTNWYVNVTNLTNGHYTFKVWGNDSLRNWFVSEVRTVTVNSTIHLYFVQPTPSDGEVVNTDSVFVNVTADQPLEVAKLEWNGQNITMKETSSENWYLNMTGLINGHYTFRVWGKDSLGNWFTSEARGVTVNRTVHLSFVKPTPDNGAVINTDYVFINMTSDQPLESAKLEWNGQNFTMQKISSKNWYLNMSNVMNGVYTFRVWGNDSLGNWFSSEVRTVTVNSTVQLYFVPPTPSDGAVVNVDSVVINVTSSQPLESAVLEWNNQNFTMHRGSSRSWYLSMTGLTNGHYTFRVWGNDSLGNWFSSETRTITVNSTVVLSFVPPTPENGAIMDTDRVLINVSSGQPLKTVLLEWNGRNLTMQSASDTNWYIEMTNLTNGCYTFRAWGEDQLGNWFSSEVRSIAINRTISLSLVSPTPQNNSAVNSDYVFVNVTSDQPLKIALLEWNGHNRTMHNTSRTNWYLNITGLTNGHYEFRAWGRDSLGNWFSTEVRTITVNSTVVLSFVPPTPENGAVVNTDYVLVNVTSGQPLKTILLEWNGQNLTMEMLSNTSWYLNVTNLTNGRYTFRVWGRDSLGNWFTSGIRTIAVNRTITLSFVPPTPEDGDVLNSNSVFINVTSSQPLKSVLLEWGSRNFTMNNASATNWYLNMTGLRNGRYTLRVWGRDSLGNWFSTEVRSVTIKVNTQSTYDIWIKLSCLWTTWFLDHRAKFMELYENATVLGVDNKTLQLALELNDNATALMLGAWRADNLEDIRANLWNFESPTRRIPRLWDIRKAFLMEKEAVEILRQALHAA
ncbi:hypothetical protein APY94_04625 [Thermococcus celericrescens]|uniref:Fibronectin type-III domain-containing protein n=1 Tax=Thermococcus celericrescens TaxID=227598 RepID=A0A100XYB8_9EURY|nr:hypothetical protein [Thermococcus celericrescens]KUH33811.1 hypothetical protein APY94_04625 [Thermococcus celericrescens]